MSEVNARLGDTPFQVRPGESLLDACRRAAVTVPFSCGAGVCQACLLKCVEGAVPEAAQRGLSADLSAKGYLLACQCRPTGDMDLTLPDPADRRIDAMLHSADPAGPFIQLRFETARMLPCESGDRVMVAAPTGAQDAVEIIEIDPDSYTMHALLPANTGTAQWFASAAFGAAFRAWGPLDLPRDENAFDLAAPETDPQLWEEVGGPKMRAVLEDFYREVYADPQLAPFFDGVTQQRLVEKQYSFLRQLMTGERVYFGDRPRNAHHWMVIPAALFEHREGIMRRQLIAHGLNESQIARWMRLESHYRRDIVKAQPWPRRVGGVDLPLDGYGKQVLDEGTLCDHCGDALDAGTEVQYHLRLGRVSCPQCAA
jgi:ferredoxin/truncated hemoglobin YjbI